MAYEVVKRFNYLLIMNNTNIDDNLTREFIGFYASVFNNKNPNYDFPLN
jgi:hypothetical protein